MRVLVTTDAVGGVWTYTRELVTGLLRQNVDVTLVSFGRLPSASQTAWLDERVDFRPTPFPLEWMPEAEREIEESCRYLEAVIEETAPDLLHLNQYCYGAVRSDVPRIVVAHSDVVSWWQEVKGEAPPDSSWFAWYRETVQKGLAGATAVVTPSRWMRDALCRNYRVCEPLVIYNGRYPKLFAPRAEKETITVGVGRLWDEAKQISLLASLGDDDLQVIIAGDSASPQPGAREERTATPRVQFRGMQSEEQVAELLARAAIYAGTSRYEPFGLAPVEAAFSGCALVLNDIPSFREIWGDAAVYFRRNQPNALAGCIRALQAAPGLRRAYAHRAYERAIRCFSADLMVNKYLQLYSGVAAGVPA